MTPGNGPRGSGGSGAFAVGYKKHSGDMMVYGGGALTVFGMLAAVVNGTPGFLIAALVGSLSALYFYPVTDTRRPLLAANQDGIYVARVGIIPWREVAGLEVERRALRTMHLSTLKIALARPLSEAVSQPERVPPAERFTARNHKVVGNTVRVTLHTLAMSPDAIERRLRALRGVG